MKKFTTITNILLAFLFGITTIANAQWIQIGQDIDGEAVQDLFGWSVSLNSDGSVVAIGAITNDGNGTSAGHVRVYQNISDIWTKIGQDIDGEASYDASGYSVSLSSDGSFVAIGAKGNDGNGQISGHVRIYENISSIWIQIGEDIDGEALGDGSGYSVSLSSDASVVAIGAMGNDGSASSAGHVRIYQYISSSWTQIGEDIDGENASDQSGCSVSLNIDGSIVAIGSMLNDGNGINSGHVKIFQNISGTWTQIGEDIDGEAPQDHSGRSVSLSSDGSVVAIGASSNNGNGNHAGHVRIYQNIAGIWTQIGQDIDGEAAQDQFGWSVSLNSDGSILAVGAPHNAGRVRIYQNNSGTWTKIGQDIGGEVAGDLSGFSVSLNSDGSVVAIGAIHNAGNGIEAGHVRVYNNFMVGTDELINTMNISVFPNPTSANITIEGVNIQNVKIRNVNGQLIREITVNNKIIDIDLSNQPKGIYLIHVTTDKGVTVKKVVVE